MAPWRAYTINLQRFDGVNEVFEDIPEKQASLTQIAFFQSQAQRQLRNALQEYPDVEWHARLLGRARDAEKHEKHIQRLTGQLIAIARLCDNPNEYQNLKNAYKEVGDKYRNSSTSFSDCQKLGEVVRTPGQHKLADPINLAQDSSAVKKLVAPQAVLIDSAPFPQLSQLKMPERPDPKVPKNTTLPSSGRLGSSNSRHVSLEALTKTIEDYEKAIGFPLKPREPEIISPFAAYKPSVD